MSIVNHKTSTPGASDIYGYAFLTLPSPKSPSNPKGVTIDDKILPVRDIYDSQHNTDTWKEMHGVDLYFLEEAEGERYYATTQFSSNRGSRPQWPVNWQGWYTWNKGTIGSGWWRTVCGRYDEIGEPTHLGGIGRFYKDYFLNINSVSELPSDIMTYKDGSDMELYIPTGLGYPHAGQYCYSYPVDIIAPLDQSMMLSHLSDWPSDSPLYAQPIRNLYKDLEKLRFYMIYTNSTAVQEEMTSSDAYKSQIWVDAWYKTETDYSQWGGLYIDPDHPTNGWSSIQIINEYSKAFGTQGQSSYNGMYEICESDYGQYKIPYCGKTDSGYNPIYGSEVAVYACLKLSWFKHHSQWEKDKYGLFKMNDYRIDRSSGFVELDTWELVRAGYRLIDRYNARVPRQPPVSWHEDCGTFVTVEKMYLVCQVSDRTDTTQLNWNRRPT